MEKRMIRRADKRPALELSDESNIDEVFRFKVLLPNETSINLTLRDTATEMPFDLFLVEVKREYSKAYSQFKSLKQKRQINWMSRDLYIVDANNNVISEKIMFCKYKRHKCHILRLYDGRGEVSGTFKNMWDLTPDTDLLLELPEEYTFETALADLIDNSLQAVWLNGEDDRRLISVNISEDRISIFDSGPGMDGSEENCLVKWGKIGASLHRLSKQKAIGGKPPYLTPFFGMFGYGGPIASMHLGRHALVSSKTKYSRKVYMLHLKREALINPCSSDLAWRTDGGLRDPSEEETGETPHGSFTKVEIFEPQIKSSDILQLQFKLKDIYFPYIQCDEVTEMMKTIRPIEFQVNGVDLAEVEGGEVAITNLHSCNGPDFILELAFSYKQEDGEKRSSGLGTSLEANARLKFIYIPITKGRENIDRILEKLKSEGCEVDENFENYSRVSVRRLGRLLPDARWARLPFMELRQRKGDKGSILKRCCSRVKCFIDTDAGFNPTPSKTDIAHHNPFSTALKNFGGKQSMEEDVQVKIYRGRKLINLVQLEREYQEWILQMHDRYDEESDSGEDQPVHVINPSNKKALGISAEVVRVHKILKRKGSIWKRGQQIKIIKGACAGFHKNNVYATIEYFLLEGLQGDAGGETRIVCRQLGIPDENGCELNVNNGNASLDICSSFSLPVNVIDSGKCIAVDAFEWSRQFDRQCQKKPSLIELLGAEHCQQLEINGVLPVGTTIFAGHQPPRDVVAVARPASFNSNMALKKLDQKSIVKSDLAMLMDVIFRGTDDNEDKNIYSVRVSCSSRKNFHGLYVFPLGRKFPDLFNIVGTYTFKFSLAGGTHEGIEKKVQVKPSFKFGKWKILGNEQLSPYIVRVGSGCVPLPIASYDVYGNQRPFKSIPDIEVKIQTKQGVFLHADQFKAVLSSDNLILNIKDVLVKSSELDKIQPNYKAKLLICQQDEKLSASIPCKVLPGYTSNITFQPPISKMRLLPGCVIEELVLEMFDAYGNHVMQGHEIELKVDGFCIQDKIGEKLKVDVRGCIDLSGILKVTAGYGKCVSLSILSDKKVFKQEVQIEERQLRLSSKIPEVCIAGSRLENLTFEVINSDGDVDKSIHNDEKYGQLHTLTIQSESRDTEDSVRYTFQHGHCVVPAVSIPDKGENLCLVAYHSRYNELHLSIKISVLKAPKVDNEEAQTLCLDIVPHDDSSLLDNLTKSMVSLSPLNLGLHHDITKVGQKIGKTEICLKILAGQKQKVEQELSNLPASPEVTALNGWDPPAKRDMTERISNMGDSAVSLICNFLKALPRPKSEVKYMDDVIGIVALLGTTCSWSLSRMLGQFLGEEQMVAIVCRSYDSAFALERYKDDGSIEDRDALHATAASIGKSIKERFLVLCLEELSPYEGEIEENDQRWLKLPYPTSSTGHIPDGFIGYAINMINIETCVVNTRTAAGHGLRETLLYNLFGELQVYETRKKMREASACITHGAISLDGGIFKQKGVLSFGLREPQIYFPVVTPDFQVPLCSDAVELQNRKTELQAELSMIVDEITAREKALEKYMKKFRKKQAMYKKLLDEFELSRNSAIKEEMI